MNHFESLCPRLPPCAVGRLCHFTFHCSRRSPPLAGGRGGMFPHILCGLCRGQRGDTARSERSQIPVQMPRADAVLR